MRGGGRSGGKSIDAATFMGRAMSDDDDDDDDEGDGDGVMVDGDGDCIDGGRAWRCDGREGREGGEDREGQFADGECEQELWRAEGGGRDIDERAARGDRGFVGAQRSREGNLGRSFDWVGQPCEFQLFARESILNRAWFRCRSFQSTTFNIMVGRERPSGGSVFLGPLDITVLSLPHRARLGIGYLTQVTFYQNYVCGFRVKSLSCVCIDVVCI